MGIHIKNSYFENNGTGIKANGKVDMTIEGGSFVGNNKDIDISVDEKSNIIIEDIRSINCKTDSITYKEYSSKVKEIHQFVDEKKELFTEQQIEQLKSLIEELNNSKDDSSKIKKLLLEIYGVGKNTVSALIVEYIKVKYGWK